MNRIMLVAAREFIATTGNKGFLIGLLIMPAMFALVAVIAPRIMSARSPQIVGEVAVIDPTGKVADELRREVSVDAITRRRQEGVRQSLANSPGGEAARRAGAEQAAEQALGSIPNLTVVERPAGSDLQQGKQWLIEQGSTRHLALVVLHPTAVERPSGAADFGSYDLYVSGTLDDATEGVVYEGIRQGLISARMSAAKFDRAVVDATMRVPRPRSVIVTEGGEQQAQRGFTRILPFVLGILLFMGIMIGGQTLMTSTIEEKSSRVIEVLLAAVSPLELMWGKLLGQMAVGLLVMSVYAGLGILALFQFAMLGLLDPMVVVYLMLFFVLRRADDGDRRVGQSDGGSTVDDGAGDDPDDRALYPHVVHRPGAELDDQCRCELHPAGERVRDDGAARVRFASARLAGRRDRAPERGCRLRDSLVCRQDLQDRPADARQAADVRHARALGQAGITTMLG
jgi:ABC-2 type transport system permease protein